MLNALVVLVVLAVGYCLGRTRPLHLLADDLWRRVVLSTEPFGALTFTAFALSHPGLIVGAYVRRNNPPPPAERMEISEDFQARMAGERP